MKRDVAVARLDTERLMPATDPQRRSDIRDCKRVERAYGYEKLGSSDLGIIDTSPKVDANLPGAEGQ